MYLEIKELSQKDNIHLRAAEEWCKLGDYLSANNEIEKMEPMAKAHPAVLSLRLIIYRKTEQHDMAANVSRLLITMIINLPEHSLSQADAARCRRTVDGIAEAKQVLLMAQAKSPREYKILFKLACCCAQLDELDESAQWLKKAMAIDNTIIQKLIVDEPGLKPLWDSMSGTI